MALKRLRSKAFAGIISKQDCETENLHDIRHLSLSLKRAIINKNLPPKMISGKNQSARNVNKRRFAMDIKARCVAELTKAHKYHAGDIDKIKDAMSGVQKAIIMCYRGYCETYMQF